MSFDDGRPRLPGAAPAGPGLLGRVAGVLFGIVALVLTLTLSVFVFAFVVVVGAIALGYFWWRTRDARRQLREVRERYARGEFDGAPRGFGGAAEGRPGHAAGRGADAAGGRVIDGEAVREDDAGRR